MKRPNLVITTIISIVALTIGTNFVPLCSQLSAQARETLTLSVNINVETRRALNQLRAAIPDTSTANFNLNTAITAIDTSIIVDAASNAALPPTPFQIGIRTVSGLEIARVTATAPVSLPPAPGNPAARYTLTVVRGLFNTNPVAAPANNSTAVYVLKYDSVVGLIRGQALLPYIQGVRERDIRSTKNSEADTEVSTEKELSAQ